MHCDSCSAGPGEIDSILYIFAQFSLFFKKNVLVVTWCPSLECVCTAGRLPSPFASDGQRRSSSPAFTVVAMGLSPVEGLLVALP